MKENIELIDEIKIIEKEFIEPEKEEEKENFKEKLDG